MNKKDIEKLLGGKHGAIFAENSHEGLEFHYNEDDILEKVIHQRRGGSGYYCVFLDVENVEQHIKDFKEDFSRTITV